MTDETSITILTIDIDKNVEVVEFIPADIPKIFVTTIPSLGTYIGTGENAAVKIWQSFDAPRFLAWYEKFRGVYEIPTP